MASPVPYWKLFKQKAMAKTKKYFERPKVCFAPYALIFVFRVDGPSLTVLYHLTLSEDKNWSLLKSSKSAPNVESTLLTITNK